jgi:hypothetical protein
MRFLDSLLKAEQKIQSRIDRIFGKGAAQSPLEMRRQILEEVENHIIRRSGRRIFPFNRLAIHVPAAGTDRRNLLSAAFQEEDALANDIRLLLKEAGCETPGNLQILLDFTEADATSAEPCQLEFLRDEQKEPPRSHRTPTAEFVILKGSAEQSVYRLEKERIQIGRLKELLDKEGQMVRRNDLVFLDNEDEINATVGRAHATVFFVRDKGEFRIADEMSRYGTRIFRDGHPIEVPSGNPRGVRLRPGDEIYVGHACMHFDCREPADEPNHPSDPATNQD